MQWVEVDGKTRLMVGEKINRFIPNPTFDPVPKPGALDEYFRGRNPRGADTPDLFGELDRMADVTEYRDRDVRLELMDRQGMQGAIFLPTLGVGMEQALIHDPEALVAAFRAFNRWMDEDWGFAYQERIFAAPMFTLVDPASAVDELEWALDQDARFLLMLPGPVMTPSGGKSPSDPIYDPFWARINEAGARSSSTAATAATASTPPTGVRAGRTRRSARTRSRRSCRRTPRRTRSPTCSPTTTSTASRTCAWRRSRPARTGCSTSTRS